MTQKNIYRITGDAEPFIPRKVYQCPGTIYPSTVVVTPFGVVYQAFDGIRIFDGNTSTPDRPSGNFIFVYGSPLGLDYPPYAVLLFHTQLTPDALEFMELPIVTGMCSRESLVTNPTTAMMTTPILPNNSPTCCGG